MEISHRIVADAVVVSCQGNRLDAQVALKFKDAFRDLTEFTQTRYILDMSQINFMDSSGLGAVVAVYKMIGPDKTLDLAALTPAVDRVFKLTRMDSVFGIYPDPQAALEAARNGAGRAAG